MWNKGRTDFGIPQCEIFLKITIYFWHMRMAYAGDIQFQKMKSDTYLFEDLPQYHSSSIH